MALVDSDLNPSVKAKLRLAKMLSPSKRAEYLGNDMTGMKQHYGDIERNTIGELKPVVKRYTTWDHLTALKPLRSADKLSIRVRADRRDDFWGIYKRLISAGYSRKAVIEFIKEHGTVE